MVVKNVLKKCMLGLGFLICLPLIIVTKFEEWFSGGKRERVFSNCNEVVALVPTVFGVYLRTAFYASVCADVSWDARFLLGSLLAHRDTTIGSGTIIGAYSIIGFADIGKDVLCSSRVSVLSGRNQHGSSTVPHSSRSVSDLIFSRVKIGDRSWLGEGAIITEDVGVGCSIGAGSILFKKADDGGAYLGNPARRIDVRR